MKDGQDLGRIGLVGTFDVENFGDCMFPELYAHLLKARLGPVDVTLYSPLARAAEILSFDHVEALPDQPTSAALAGLDVDTLILIGGETVGRGHSAGTFNFPTQTLSSYLRLWMVPILAARDPGARPTRAALHCVGATKMTPEQNAQVAQVMAAADRVRFRDAFSASWIVDGETSFGVDIDPMFLIDTLMDADGWHALATRHLPQGVAPGGYIAAQVTIGYGGNDLEAWAKSVSDIAKSAGLPVVLVPICHFLEDTRLLSRIAPLIEAHGVTCHLVGGQVNVKVTAALVGQSAGYVGSSLHGAVTAVAFARPLAVLGHSLDGKHEGTLAAVGLPGLVAIASPDLPERFARAGGLDRKAARVTAHGLARNSFNGLIDGLLAAEPPHPDRTARAQAAAAALIAQEKATAPSAIKRLALRAVRATPGLSDLYRRYRVWKVFRHTGVKP